jgi:hypothetical protein
MASPRSGVFPHSAAAAAVLLDPETRSSAAMALINSAIALPTDQSTDR